MDLYGSIWDDMDLYGSMWVYIDLYGFIWVNMDLQNLGGCLESMDLPACPRSDRIPKQHQALVSQSLPQRFDWKSKKLELGSISGGTHWWIATSNIHQWNRSQFLKFLSWFPIGGDSPLSGRFSRAGNAGIVWHSFIWGGEVLHQWGLVWWQAHTHVARTSQTNIYTIVYICPYIYMVEKCWKPLVCINVQLL